MARIGQTIDNFRARAGVYRAADDNLIRQRITDAEQAIIEWSRELAKVGQFGE